MPKVFNITGNCIPRLHDMVNLDSRLQVTRKLVDAGQYITINRGRRYSNTTTLKTARDKERSGREQNRFS